jgi:hypothetical protein
MNGWNLLVECGLSEASWYVGVLDSSELPHALLRGRYWMANLSEDCRDACVLNGRENYGRSGLSISSGHISSVNISSVVISSIRILSVGGSSPNLSNWLGTVTVKGITTPYCRRYSGGEALSTA